LGITLAREAVSEVWEEALPLAERHHLEVGPLPQSDFKIVRDRSDLLEKIGLLRIYTARDQGKLVGYASIVLDPNHDMYQGVTWGMQSALYVRPDHRNYMPFRFLRYQDLALATEGIHIVYRHAPISTNFGKLLLHLGYRLNDRGYIRDLREAA
jgi:hypothetical protein